MATSGNQGAENSGTIVLVSQEGQRFEVPRKVAQMSELVKTMTEDGGMLLFFGLHDLFLSELALKTTTTKYR